MASAGDSVIFQNISATTAQFPLYGGTYGIVVSATFGGGSVQLQTLAADGATWVSALASITAAGLITGPLPAGAYRVQVTTATAVYVAIVRVN